MVNIYTGTYSEAHKSEQKQNKLIKQTDKKIALIHKHF